MRINLKRLYTISLLSMSTNEPIIITYINTLYNEPVIKRYDTFRFYFFIKIFNDKSMKDIEPKRNEALKLNCQQMLKKNNTHTCDEFFFTFI